MIREDNYTNTNQKVCDLGAVEDVEEGSGDLQHLAETSTEHVLCYRRRRLFRKPQRRPTVGWYRWVSVSEYSGSATFLFRGF